ncbi:MAG: hypothetical protein KFF50_10620, partial [Desulfatitalea sp.]|nr:hypothetical protein [Desulfatitalea sp.]
MAITVSFIFATPGRLRVCHPAGGVAAIASAPNRGWLFHNVLWPIPFTQTVHSHNPQKSAKGMGMPSLR